VLWVANIRLIASPKKRPPCASFPPTPIGDKCGIGIQQKLASSLPRLRLTLLEREYQSCENHGTQKSRCQPNGIAIESN
jgi:hypothetical protein